MNAEAAKKYWIQTFTGKKFFPLQPTVESLDFVDQAHALSHICRYNGHVAQHYSVAEHAWRLSLEAERRGYDENVRKWCLIHDNSEAYLGDVVRPIKVQPEFTLFREAEKTLQAMIATWLGLPEGEPRQCRELDTEILGTEAFILKQPVHPDWVCAPPWGTDATLWGLTPAEARYRYLWRFRVLWGDAATRMVPDLWKYMSPP